MKIVCCRPSPFARVVAAFALFVAPMAAFAQAGARPSDNPQPSAAELLSRVDSNEVYSSIAYKGEMIIEYQGKRYVKDFSASARGNADSFIEFTNAEDRGTKYLRTGGRLYVYSPDTEQVMLISGHLLKESMMGSDMSYEDTIENSTLTARYDPTLAGSETLNGRDAWTLDLAAKKKTESYPRQKLWIAKDNGDCLKVEYYALSGAKLKEYELVRSEKIGSRNFPMESVMRDLLRKGSSTTFKMRDVTLDAQIPDSTFGMRNLER
jgi:outer membrane lipoprotein-sorting protein